MAQDSPIRCIERHGGHCIAQGPVVSLDHIGRPKPDMHGRLTIDAGGVIVAGMPIMAQTRAAEAASGDFRCQTAGEVRVAVRQAKNGGVCCE